MHGRGTNIRTNGRMDEQVGGRISQTADRTRGKKELFFSFPGVRNARFEKKIQLCRENVRIEQIRV